MMTSPATSHTTRQISEGMGSFVSDYTSGQPSSEVISVLASRTSGHGSMWMDSVALSRTLPSFTPINKDQALQQVRTQSGPRPQPRGVDGDQLFELPEEPLSICPDLNYQKRKPKYPSNQRQSSKLSKMENGASQLSTLPASKKRATRQATLKKTELFSNANINKHVSSQTYRTREKCPDRGKTGLAKSTIEKLASFIYQEPHVQPTQQDTVDKNILISHSHLPVFDNWLEDNENMIFDDLLLSESSLVPNTSTNVTLYQEQIVQQISENRASTTQDNEMSTMGYQLLITSSKREGSTIPTDMDDEFPMDSGDEQEMVHLRLLERHKDEDFPMDSQDEKELAQLPLYEGPVAANETHNLNEPASDEPQSDRTGYDHCQHPGIRSITLTALSAERASPVTQQDYLSGEPHIPVEDEWAFITQEVSHQAQRTGKPQRDELKLYGSLAKACTIKDSEEYSAMPVFARPNYPSRVLDRSRIMGISGKTVLRTCFRIGELLREGKHCEAIGQDAVVELFARITFSSREIGTCRQHFQFADLFHEHPPFPNGILENYKISGLQETESGKLQGVEGLDQKVRCLGRLKRVVDGTLGWTFHIINIRATDWEEVRWTKNIAGAGMEKKKRHC